MKVSDDELMERLKRGDEEAFTELYERYATDIYRHLLMMMKNKQEAEDMLHESFMLLIEKANFYISHPHLKNSFRAWFYRLSTNRAIDEFRKKKPKELVAVEEQISPIDHEIEIETQERDLIITHLMEKLPLVQRMLISLRVQDELSYGEISAICGKDINAVKQGLFQARRNLKNLMLAHGEIL